MFVIAIMRLISIENLSKLSCKVCFTTKCRRDDILRQLGGLTGLRQILTRLDMIGGEEAHLAIGQSTSPPISVDLIQNLKNDFFFEFFGQN